MKIKLKTYLWKGANKQGEKLQGEKLAPNEVFVKVYLRQQGIVSHDIRKKSKKIFSKNKITKQDILVFTRQIATLLTAGIPLIQSLELTERGYKKTEMQTMINNLKVAIESGVPVNESMLNFPRYFNEFYRNLIAAGEASGSLDIMFARLALYTEKTNSLKGKIKKALFYPFAVILVSVVVTAGMLMWVVPQFELLFAGFGAVLPVPTRMVIHFSKFMQYYGGYFLCVILAIIGGLVGIAKRSALFLYQVDRILLKLPVVGIILTKAAVARFARTLAITFAAGLPLTDALEAVSGATGNRVYGKAIKRIRVEVTTGKTLSASLKHPALFPLIAIQMIAIGEESGMLENMLIKIADIFEQEVDNAVDGLSSLIEPVIMIIMGVLIGGLVITMYLPIFKLGNIV